MKNSYSNCSGGADRAPYAVDNQIKNLKKGPRNFFFSISGLPQMRKWLENSSKWGKIQEILFGVKENNLKAGRNICGHCDFNDIFP